MAHDRRSPARAGSERDDRRASLPLAGDAARRRHPDRFGQFLAGAATALLGADDYTSGAGVWSASKKSVTFRFQRFFTKNGAYVGSQVVAGTGKMKGKKTVQVATATFYDSAGKMVGIPVTIDATGTRMRP